MTAGTATRPDATTSRPLARWVAFAAAAIGAGVSAYLTVEHYAHSTSLACPESATVNCLKVTTSRWSTVAGIPVAVLGLAFFAVMAVAVLVPLRQRSLRLGRLVAAGTGVAAVLYLVFIELFEVNAICLWCTAAHVCAVAVFAAVLWTDALPD